MPELLIVLVAIAAILFILRQKKVKPELNLSNSPLKREYRMVLQKHFRYYKDLPDDEKKEFERRLENFIRNKRFIPMNGLKRVTGEMKVFISSAAIQLTFGLSEVYFSHFKNILVFPDKYLHLPTNTTHAGEVNEDGHIAFSWRHFVNGYKNAKDTFNLGLHEMAHALSIENQIRNKEYNFLNMRDLLYWKAVADKEFHLIKSKKKKSFLRSYALTHRSEFFPVCIEHFFEQPAKLKKIHPELYIALTRLLKQDPLIKTGRIDV